MVGICYPGHSRHSAAYEPSFARKKEKVDKRGRKNLFRTALDKLTKKQKNKKVASENVYEVVVVYKDKQLENDDSEHIDPKHDYKLSEDVIHKTLYTSIGPPKAPPRTRSRPHSRNSHTSSELNTIPPTPPPRSRSHSHRSSMIQLDRAPTPPPRSRPQSRNSCRGSLPKIDKVKNLPPNLQNDKKSDLSKPPIPPMRSPLRKQRKQAAGKSADQTKPSRQSVSLADLASGLDYIDIDEMEEAEIESKPKILKSTSTSKLYNSEDILACNARMDSRWAVVMNSSNLSLDTPGKVVEQETYLGPGYSTWLSTYHRTQSYSGLADQQQDTSAVSRRGLIGREAELMMDLLFQVLENNLGQLAPLDRVKVSLGRLDIPDWYTARQDTDQVATTSQRTAWSKGSFPNLPNPTSKSTPCSPVPPSSPPSSYSSWRKNLRDNSFSPSFTSSPSSPKTCPAKQPYTGWRSQDKLPVFLHEGMNSKLEGESMKSRGGQAKEE